MGRPVVISARVGGGVNANIVGGLIQISGGTPGDTVVTETAFGQASTAGVAPTLSRSDHTHGTPTAPTAGSVGADPSGTAAGLLAAHVAAADPHTGYLTPAEGDGAYDPLGAAAAAAGSASAALAAHVAAPDPHPGYLTPAEGDVAYTPLAHRGAAPSDSPEPHPGYATDAELAAGDAASVATAAGALAAHVAAADPHTGYQKESEKGSALGYASLDGAGTVPTAQLPAATTAAAGAVVLATPSSDTTAGHVVQASDTRLSDARAPTGAAGGDLSGTYPSPTVARLAGTTPTTFALTLIDDADQIAARTTLGVVIGVDVASQAAVVAAQSTANAALPKAGGTMSGTLDFGGQSASNLPDPTSAQDAATKAYVDALAYGLDTKASVRTATTSALPAYTALSGVLTASANGALPAQDGVTLTAGQSLLVKDEGGGSSARNGIYVVTQAGSAGTPWILTRRGDANVSAEVTSGLYTFVSEGTTQGGNGYALTTPDPIVLETTALAFSQTSAPWVGIDGEGLTLTGNVFSVNVDGSTIEISADVLRVKDGGIGYAKLANAALSALGPLTPSANKLARYTSGSAADLVSVSATPAATTVPISDVGGKLTSWIDAATTLIAGVVKLGASGGAQVWAAILDTFSALPNGTGWLKNNGAGVLSWSTPTAADVGAAPTSRTISTTAPLAGGGALTGDLTLTVGAASTSAAGVVELAADLEATAGLAVQASDSRLLANGTNPNFAKAMALNYGMDL